MYSIQLGTDKSLSRFARWNSVSSLIGWLPWIHFSVLNKAPLCEMGTFLDDVCSSVKNLPSASISSKVPENEGNHSPLGRIPLSLLGM